MCKATCAAGVPMSADEAPQMSNPPGTPANDSSIWRRPLVLLAACGLITALASTSDLREHIQVWLAMLRPILQEHPITGVLVLILGAAVSAMAAFLSIAVLVPVAVFAWGEASTMLMLWIGWILGGVLAYGLAWHLGQRVIRWIGARS